MAIEIKEIGAKGEILIPKCFRHALGLLPKDKVRMMATDKAVIILPVKKEWKDFAGSLSNKDDINKEQLEKLAFEVMYSERW